MGYFNQRFLGLFTCLMLAIVFFQCKGKGAAADVKKGKDTPVVDVIIASVSPISDVVEANGTVIAAEFVELRSEVNGRLTYLNLPEGKTVAQGTVLARVNDADLRAQMAKSKVQLDLAQKTASRFKQLLNVNGLNQSDYDAALNQVNTLQADINYTQTLMDKTVIKAPFSGVVGLRQVSSGAYITPATVIASLQQTNEVKIDFTLPEMYGRMIKTGMKVNVELDAESHQRRTAVVLATEPGANTATRNLKVRAVLQGGVVTPGSFVKVYIDAGKNRSSIKVPSSCIIPEDKNSQVILVKNGLASFVNIQTGVRSANTVEVVQGIDLGDSVVVTGVLFARPKAALKVRSVKKLSDLIDADAL